MTLKGTHNPMFSQCQTFAYIKAHGLNPDLLMPLLAPEQVKMPSGWYLFVDRIQTEIIRHGKVKLLDPRPWFSKPQRKRHKQGAYDAQP